ncbi:molybdopterin-dependent oxidoreductase [Mobilicoccus caccae]|uniref:molybdopterin-dependent oxidoreductase n=1 Tax=Mobilicoccus caccae TaxID=1859295 RepID=UPI0024E0F226|nr:molybdopterin-dependent oxidoreductase [Mobilicoccus caccae]
MSEHTTAGTGGDLPAGTHSDDPKESHRGPTRRQVLGGTAAAAVGVGAVGLMFREGFGPAFTQETAHGTGHDDDAYDATDVINTMCMQCNTFCTIKVRVTDPGESGASSLIRKISGNPYSPLTSQPAPCIPYDTPLAEAVVGIGTMTREARSRAGGIACLKGQAGIQTAHDSRRITQPLKRVGERGSGKWQTISWEQALAEVLDGDASLGTTGLRSWWAYAPEKPVMDDWAKVTDKSMTVAEFETTWGPSCSTPSAPRSAPVPTGSRSSAATACTSSANGSGCSPSGRSTSSTTAELAASPASSPTRACTPTRATSACTPTSTTATTSSCGVPSRSPPRRVRPGSPPVSARRASAA